MINKKMELQWKEYFRDPLLYRNAENTSGLPSFTHRITHEPVYIDALYNPTWIHQEFRRRQVSNKKLKGETSKDEHDEERSFMALLKTCAKKKNTFEGARLHKDILARGLLEKSPYLGSGLINMYAEWGMLAKAQHVLEGVPIQNIVSWNALITGYIRHGRAQEALDCFDRMQGMGLSPNAVTFICILKACGNIGAIEQGEHIHDEIISMGFLEKDIILGTALVNMYAKCGDLEKAKKTLEELPVRNEVTWSALIAGYVRHKQGHEALNLFNQMQIEGLCPDSITFISILKACGSIASILKGKQIHEEIVKRNLLENDIVLGTALVDMYMKCGAFALARKVLEELPNRNTVSWSALITGYVEEGQSHEALNCFECMWREGVFPDEIIFISILKACGNTGAIGKGKQIHYEIVKRGFLKDMVVGTALVDMYAKCGMFKKAQEILEELPIRDVVSWCALIAGYIEHGKAYEALNCFEQMISEGLSPDTVTFIFILKGYGSIRAIDRGKEIHKEVVKRDLLEKDIVLGNAVVDMYVKCGKLTEAQEVLEGLHARNVISWSTLIAGYTGEEKFNEALNRYEEMQIEGIFPNAITFVCILKACGNVGFIDKGMQIHDEIVKSGLLERNTILGNALIDMYARCGLVAKARQMLEELPIRDIVSWNALIAVYAQQGHGHEALLCFEQMQSEGLSPNHVTFTCILIACSRVGAIDKGEQIHMEIASRGFLKNDIVLGCALVDMYAKCGVLEKAQEVLEELSNQNVVSWSALIGGYTTHGQGYEALNCFEWMQSEGLPPDAITFICLLKACGNMAAIDKGKQIHEEIVTMGLLDKDIVLGTALIDMYANCAMLTKAQEVLLELPTRNVVSWCALIAGYARQGQAQQALECFTHMQSEGTLPDAITFLCLLSACSHSALLDEAQMLFGNMIRKNGLTPNIEHYTWIVGVLGCAGHFDKAISVIHVMPSSHSLGVWLALLDACRKWGNVELGSLAFDRAIQLDSLCGAPYVLMSDIYLNVGMPEAAKKVEAMKLKLSPLD